MNFLNYNKYYTGLLTTAFIGCGIFAKLSYDYTNNLRKFAIESNTYFHYLHLKHLPASEINAIVCKCRRNNCEYSLYYDPYYYLNPFSITGQLTCECPGYKSYYGLLITNTNTNTNCVENMIAYHNALYLLKNANLTNINLKNTELSDISLV